MPTSNASHPRLRAWWTDNPADPDRAILGSPAVRQLVQAISPASQATDLGGVMSLNVLLDAEGLVLRVHQPFVSRRRLLALQMLRQRLASAGVLVAEPVAWQGANLLRCQKRWAELERYVPHQRLTPTWETYRWLFAAMGTLHGALRSVDVAVPRPLVATYAPPRSLRRWLPITEAAVRSDAEAAQGARLLRASVETLQRQWIPATALPVHLVHGDISPRNVGRSADGTPAFLDFGFCAQRPRIHELAYALAFMLLALGATQAPHEFAWTRLPELVAAYEAAAPSRLTSEERRALAPYTASVPLHAAALDGFTANPSTNLKRRLPFVRLSAWLLAHPESVWGQVGPALL